MIRFDNDYTEGAHPKVLQRLMETNEEQLPGYGKDHHTAAAKALICRLCGEEVDVHFVMGGTQANLTIISSVLRPHQGVIAPDTGHIAADEAGAIESTGHKVLEIKAVNGKIDAGQISGYVEDHWNSIEREHKSQPKLVYISQPTESGTLYSREEFEAIRHVCDEKGLYLMVDGARLAYALASEENDLTLADYASICDVFYIGGTKAGILFGEAIVISNKNIKEDFRYIIKQKGGMLAKGRLLGIQFEVLFKDDLYMKIAGHALEMARTLTEVFTGNGIEMHFPSPTNQIFPVLTTGQIERLSKKYAFHVWEDIDETKKAVRFCTSWSTRLGDVEALIEDINDL
ncbi:threonine aldolase family protein [Salinicoccus halitifaciens]|uniref:Threonine aldolase n=1 Tax=Salinicoccus halitifaciens TaxID=1073415 RepID=A0ABV2E657_9STAP|nr:aminotransferase class I/II-fold pyridoxal phosphate-dependent enzyme [Salinicoccus halitifaciens]MCD2137038.1 aminotransferase class I/II-fold pyridoxal phosphate-dependent enzyme [Salinicoccus halitifaciens]